MWKGNVCLDYGGNLSLRDSARSRQGETQQLVHIRAEGEPGVAQEAAVADTVHDEEHHEGQQRHQELY